MKNLIFSLGLALSAVSVAGVASASTKTAKKDTVVSGVVEHIELMEGEGIVKLSEAKTLYIIKNLIDFPENKIQALQKSKESGAKVRLKINESNQVVDVLL